MSDESLIPFENNNLEQLLMPSWARESDGSSLLGVNNQKKYTDLDDRKEHSKGSFKNRNRNNEHRLDRPRKKTDHDRKASANSFQRHERNKDREHHVPLIPILTGWLVDFIPDQRVLDTIAKQLKAEAKAYSLFEMTRLVLEKPSRYEVIFMRNESSEMPTSRLIQYVGDGSLWLTEKEALAHVMKKYRDQFYRCESITVEPPKGNYSSVAVCGKVLLGPPNHHEYQTKLRQLYAEQFSHLPFDAFKNHVQLMHDEETLQRWKEEQSSQQEFYPLIPSEEKETTGDVDKCTEPLILKNLVEVEEHFKKEHAPRLFVEVREKITLSGVAAIGLSCPSVQNFLKNALEECRRFPLRLSQVLAEEFTPRGLQLFKAHENITYVAVARPRYLDRTTAPLADDLAAMLNYLETHQKNPRAEQWKGLLELRSNFSEEHEREAAVAKDLSWLIRQGYVVNYASRGLEIVKQARAY